MFSRPKRSLPYLLVTCVWHWRWELLIAIAAYAVHTRLVQAGLTHLVAALMMAAVLGLLLVVPHSRYFLHHRFWCVVVRHRLRVCLRELRTMNHSGNAALILAARATLEGQALWLWMRPGLSVEDLERRQEAIAAACWASDARVTRSHRLAALVRVDIVRRDPLAASHIPSPLLGLSEHLPSAPITDTRALHLIRSNARPTADPTTPAPPTPTVASAAGGGTPKNTKQTSQATAPSLVVLRNGEDVSDYV
jgi:hypothetical protein